jgi:tRNA-intron lyase
MSSSSNDHNKYQLPGELKYNSVFVTHDNYKILSDQGFGAKQFKPIDKRKQNYTKNTLTTPASSLETPNVNNINTPNTDDSTNGFLSSPFSLLSPLFSPFYSSQSSTAASDTTSPILLFDEEAFYLFSNGFLKVTNPDGSIVTSLQLWSKFLEKNEKFPLKYKVYSFFRDQGYVVKTGVHYGIDFAVYRTTPNRCHSEICAMVVDATSPLNIHDDKPSTCQQGWRHISTLTRVMPDVMKLSVLCYVLPKEWATKSDISDKKNDYDNNKMNIEENNDKILSKIFDENEMKPKKEESIWQRMFGQKSIDINSNGIDFSTPKCLDELTVRPISSLVRRLVAKSDHYLTIGGTQEKYRKCSILKAPRQERTGKKKRRKRRDHTELRVKSQSKHNKMWKALGKPTAPLIQSGAVTNVEDTNINMTEVNESENTVLEKV